MEIEFQRGQRHDYPVCCLALRPDRIDQLGLIHGQESRDEVLRTILDLVRRTIRAGDLMGFTEDERLILILPHQPPESLKNLCNRIIKSAAGLVFETGNRTHQTTLSMGASHSRHPEALNFATLERVALDGLEVAEAGGGDRWIESELYGLESASEPMPATGTLGDADQHSAAELLFPNYRDRLVEMVARGGSLEDAARELSDEIVQRAIQAQAEDASGVGAEEKLELLRRRIAKLTQTLGVSETELKELRAFKQASIERGELLSGSAGERSEGTGDALRADLMRTIFDANVDLRRRTDRDAG